MVLPILSIAELFDRAIGRALRNFRVCDVGRVERYNSDDDTVDVQPLAQRWIPGEDDDEDAPTLENDPVVPHVPIARLRGAGGFLSFPVQKGDFVLLVYANRSIGEFLRTGSIYNPKDQRENALGNAIAVLGIWPAAKQLAQVSTVNIVFGFEDGLQVTIKPGAAGTVEVGNVPALDPDAAALASFLNKFLQVFMNTPAPSPGGGAALQAAVLAQLGPLLVAAGSTTADPDVGSKKLKVEN